MKVVLQRVTRASVSIGGTRVSQIEAGYCLLVGFTHSDTPGVTEWMAEKIAGLRVCSDADGKLNLALAEAGGAVLVVSQFPLYEGFCAQLRARGLAVATGEFGAMMQVEILNDGPVTLILERSA
jgi:D-aminoacyl-tRNA deacylase